MAGSTRRGAPESGPTLTIGNGGWVRHQDDGPVVSFLRFQDFDGRLRPVDVLVAGDGPVMAHHLDKVPLGQIEGAVNGEMLSRVLRDRLQRPAPLLREAATRFNDELFGRQRYADNWFAQMLRSQEGEDHPMPSTPVPARALRAKTSSDFTIEKNPDLRLERPAAKPYGDDFYRKVVQAYQAAALIDDHPNVLLARVNKYEVTTVRGWVRTARKRNLMARGRKGSVG